MESGKNWPNEYPNIEPSEIYKPKLKLFGEKAERVQKNELEAVIFEILGKARDSFVQLEPTEQLDDKESFGDIDLICEFPGEIDEEFFRKIFGENLIEYGYIPERNRSEIYSMLISLSSGKTIHVDFIRARDQAAFQRDLIYYSKGHLSSMVGILAKKLGFKYGAEGFFKRFHDKRGNWHDVLISDNLEDGLRILGLDLEEYYRIKETSDVIDFVQNSPLFDSAFFSFGGLNRAHRESIIKVPSQGFIAEKLFSANKSRSAENDDEFLIKLFPEKYAQYQKDIEKIDRDISIRKKLNGTVVVGALKLKPGPWVRNILKYINDNYPDAESLTDEMIARVKEEFKLT